MCCGVILLSAGPTTCNTPSSRAWGGRNSILAYAHSSSDMNLGVNITRFLCMAPELCSNRGVPVATQTTWNITHAMCVTQNERFKKPSSNWPHSTAFCRCKSGVCWVCKHTASHDTRVPLSTCSNAIHNMQQMHWDASGRDS